MGFFLVLPLLQTLTKAPTTDLTIMSVDTAIEPPPPPPPEAEPEEEPEPEEAPPELEADTTPLTLDQLTLALNPSFGEGALSGDFTVNLNSIASGGQGVEELFSLADLDQKPRAIMQTSPRFTPDIDKARKNGPGTVYIIFIVDEKGRVQSPKVQKSSNSVFDNEALKAIKKWKFEPGKRGGKPVRTRMRVPITFPQKG